jgi:hypothetical protein
VASGCTNSAYFFARDSRHCEKPFHERHLTKSGFGKPKATKLDNPSDAVLRERGHGAVLGDEGKAVGMQSATCLRMPCPPAASRRPGLSKNKTPAMS